MGIKRNAPAADSYIDDEEEILPPVVRKARPAEIDDTEDDEADVSPALARAAAKRREVVEDDEDEAPRSRSQQRRLAVQEEDDEPDDDDDDEETGPPVKLVSSGWGAAKALQSEGGDYTTEFRLTEEGSLVKFLEDAPMAAYRQHFLREKDGKKSYICLGNGCPLCQDLGHTPDKKFAFNVVDLTQPTYAVSLLVAGPRLLGILEKSNSGKNGPLDKHYWEISRSGTGTKTSYNLQVVKDRYLEDEYGLNPAEVEATLRKIKPLSSDAVKVSTRAELRQIVAELDA